MREVGWVIFDEIHYMRDKERGVVWEETIILLPDNVHYVFLSATIPNARQFAEWICYLHKQPCHVVYTEYRPVPLQHYIFPAGGDGLHLVVDEKGVFKEDNFNLVMTTLQNAAGNAKGDTGLRGKKGGFRSDTNCYKIVKMIMERDYSPVIIFSFSKRECEAYATQMSKLDLNSAEEKKLVNEVFNNAMEALSDEDRELPQVQNVLPLLMRGIAIHHGGLLPILKETIEILFSEGLIKALFATETFAMGLNMPARTVLFTNARKYDGQSFRWVTSGEYIQMSGRAGRRGLDDRGRLNKFYLAVSNLLCWSRLNDVSLFRYRHPDDRREDEFSISQRNSKGSPGCHQLGFPSHVQHGAEPAACRGYQPRVHAGKELLPVPKLRFDSSTLST